MVPLLRRYYRALRLPSVPFAALRCLRLAIPALRPGLLPAASMRRRGPGELDVPVPEPELCGDDRVSQVPGEPSCAFALLFDPGRTDRTRPVAVCRRGPRFHKSEDSRERFRGSITRPGHSLSTLRREGHPSTTQDSLPAAGQALPDGFRYPQGSDERFRVSSLFLLSQASWRNVEIIFRIRKSVSAHMPPFWRQPKPMKIMGLRFG